MRSFGRASRSPPDQVAQRIDEAGRGGVRKHPVEADNDGAAGWLPGLLIEIVAENGTAKGANLYESPLTLWARDPEGLPTDVEIDTF
jgi:hypothetical protein